MSVAEKVRQRVTKSKRGTLWTSKNFAQYGSRDAVDTALRRLTEEGVIERVGRGVYVKPKHNRFVGKVLPSPETIAKKKAESQGERVGVHGAEAVRQFGLSTQMPIRPVLLTTGRTRTIRARSVPVLLKHVPKRQLRYGDGPVGKAIAALLYLGSEHATPERVRTIMDSLQPEQRDVVKRELHTLPTWLQAALRRYEASVVA